MPVINKKKVKISLSFTTDLHTLFSGCWHWSRSSVLVSMMLKCFLTSSRAPRLESKPVKASSWEWSDAKCDQNLNKRRSWWGFSDDMLRVQYKLQYNKEPMNPNPVSLCASVFISLRIWWVATGWRWTPSRTLECREHRMSPGGSATRIWRRTRPRSDTHQCNLSHTHLDREHVEFK